MNTNNEKAPSPDSERGTNNAENFAQQSCPRQADETDENFQRAFGTVANSINGCGGALDTASLILAEAAEYPDGKPPPSDVVSLAGAMLVAVQFAALRLDLREQNEMNLFALQALPACIEEGIVHLRDNLRDGMREIVSAVDGIGTEASADAPPFPTAAKKPAPSRSKKLSPKELLDEI